MPLLTLPQALQLSPKPAVGPLTEALREARNELQRALDAHRGCPACAKEFDPFGGEAIACAGQARVERAYRKVSSCERAVSSKISHLTRDCQSLDDMDSVLAHSEI